MKYSAEIAPLLALGISTCQRYGNLSNAIFGGRLSPRLIYLANLRGQIMVSDYMPVKYLCSCIENLSQKVFS
jgi:hypothetical protein